MLAVSPLLRLAGDERSSTAEYFSFMKEISAIDDGSTLSRMLKKTLLCL